MPSLAHLADLHVGQPGALGATNTLVRAIIKRHKPEETGVVITGDLVDEPKEELYRELHKSLRPLKEEGFDLFCVPGNHDIHPAKGVDLGWLRDATYEGWERYVEPLMPKGEGTWPRLWRFGGWQIIGLDTNAGSAHDGVIDLACGGVGAEQLLALTMMLQDGPSVVLGHHRVWWRDRAHRLKDADALAAILEPRARFYLCGHQHKAEVIKRGETTYRASRRSTQAEGGKLKYHLLEFG
jgi:3',5'-cyclic AMP phosphodiesterase CpdA